MSLLSEDPLLSTANIFADNDQSAPWPTTPHPPHSPIPNLRRALTPVPPTPDKGPSAGLYGKEPQIYGQPEAGLISPRETVGLNGKTYEKPEPYLRVRVTGLDRNRRDILVKLDAQTNLPNFGGTTYRNVSRSYVEFQQFYDSVIHSNPQTIIPALPLAQTSAPTDEEDDRLVRIMLQRWLTRVCEDPILLHDEDVRAFIESDFGYQPTPRPRRKTTSGFSLIRRGVPDEDEDLQRARFELTKLEGQFFDTAKAVDKLSVARKALATARAEMGNKLVNVATTEAHPPLGNAFRKLGRAWHSLADLDQAQSISECVILGDSLGYQGMNARSAKETLQMRTGVLEEYQAAVKTTISKRRQIERLKASANIRPERVDDALEEIEEANKYEQVLAKRAEGISQNLHRALQTHNRYANDDITTALIEHTRSSIMYERQLLRELEALRVDVSNAAKKVVPAENAVPKPSIIPPLEDYSGSSPHSAPPIHNGSQRPPSPTPAQNRGLLHTPSQGYYVPQPQNGSGDKVTQGNGTRQPPFSASPSPTQSFAKQQFQHKPLMPSASVPTLKQGLPPQSPGAGPSMSPKPTFATPGSDEPPLGGRFVDGTKSMFVKGRTGPISPSFSTLPSENRSANPLEGGPLYSNVTPSRTATTSPLHDGLTRHPLAASQTFVSHTTLSNSLDPLLQSRPNPLSQSVRVQPTRPRLDAREAASKLANMF